MAHAAHLFPDSFCVVQIATRNESRDTGIVTGIVLNVFASTDLSTVV